MNAWFSHRFLTSLLSLCGSLAASLPLRRLVLFELPGPVSRRCEPVRLLRNMSASSMSPMRVIRSFDVHTSGILYLCSLSALTVQAMAVIPTTTPSMTAVFARQFLGWAYQPPAGDQTCLGYLSSRRCQSLTLYTNNSRNAPRTGPWGRRP